jgi:superfamily II DNA or RNA helicase
VSQARDAFKELYSEVGLIKADVFDLKPITVASVQTLHRRLHLIPSDYFELQVVDEAHMYMAKTFRKAVEHFAPKLRVAITATPTRMDNLSLSDIFGEVVYEYNIRDGIRDGYLVELDAVRVKTSTSLDKVSTLAGEFNQGQLSSEINTVVRNNLIADSYLKYANGRRTIVFCCSIQHAMDLCEAFLVKGIKTTAISADESKTGDRTQKVADFKAGKYDVIMNCSILGKGFDLPIVSCIIQASPTKSLTRYMQGIGRSTRPLSGVIDGLETAKERWEAIKRSDKKDSLIIDITDNTTRHNLINAWELDRELSPEERVFITQENRQKLLDARLGKNTKLEHQQTEDEFVSLLKIPRIKIDYDSEGMRKSASEKQLSWIKSLGYKIEENTYTMGMIQQIVEDLPCSRVKVEEVKSLGYAVNKILTNKDYNAVKREIWTKQNKKAKK